MPAYVMDRPEPYRPYAAIWLSGGLKVLALEIIPPGTPSAVLARLLEQAMRAPARGAGPPRRPARIRVNDQAALESVRQVAGEGIEVRVAPVPELEEIKQSIADFQRDHPADGREVTYLEDGRIAADLIRVFFEAAADLWRGAPWRHAADDQVLKLSIPALGLPRACVSILGQARQSYGLLVFDSPEGFMSHFRVAVAMNGLPAKKRDIRDLGSGFLYIAYDPRNELPASQHREIDANGWTVADGQAYPRIARVDRDIVPRPPKADDYILAILACRGADGFVREHSGLFSQANPKTTSTALEVEILGTKYSLNASAPCE
jgi:hypothetical protein